MVIGIRLGILSAALAATGCVVAAAGAGAGGAVYLSDRGVESVVTAPVDRTVAASRQAFQALGITEGKTSSERDGAVAKETLNGSTADREVTVTVRTEGTGSHVAVVVRKSAVTWDKDFAKTLLERIVKGAS